MSAQGELYEISAGDGDQTYFGIRIRMTTETWFHGEIPEWGDATLFIIETGVHIGEYVALTSRWTISIQEQLETNGVASVIVHKIRNPTATFGSSKQDYFAVGMATLRSMSTS